MTSSAPTPSKAAAGDAVAVARAHEEHDGADEQGSPRAPAEPESVTTDGGCAAVSQEGVPSLDKGGRHERDGDGVEEQGDKRHEPGDGSAQAAAAGEEAREEGEHIEEQRDQVEDPAEAPHVEVIPGGRVPSERTAVRVSCCHALMRRRGNSNSPAQSVWNIIGIVRPSVAKRHGRARPGAVDVAGAADVEVGPLRGVARTSDSSCFCSQKVGVLEG